MDRERSAANDALALSTALSTLAARVTVLERWMRRSDRRQAALVVGTLIALATSIAILILR